MHCTGLTQCSRLINAIRQLLLYWSHCYQQQQRRTEHQPGGGEELSTLIGQWPNPSIVRMNASISLYNNNHCSRGSKPTGCTPAELGLVGRASTIVRCVGRSYNVTVLSQLLVTAYYSFAPVATWPSSCTLVVMRVLVVVGPAAVGGGQQAVP